jgi:tetratricopeptide (TPR) repeat protein
MGLGFMRKRQVYLLAGLGIAVVAIFVTLPLAVRKPAVRAEDVLAAYRDKAQYGGLTVRYPLDGTLFPAEIVPPTFQWEDETGKSGSSGQRPLPESDAWVISVKFQDSKDASNFVAYSPQWTPQEKDWESIKKRSLEKEAQVVILGVSRSNPAQIMSAGRVTIKTSADEVGAPLFYREVNLPFIDAVKDPSEIRWRFGPISSPKPPPIVLTNLPVCGNCHSFSESAKILAMDVDYANSKGSYVITRVAEEMVLATSDIITWNDYRREDEEQTFGLLSQVSPDGRYVVSTVKDKSVFVPMPPLAFSQLFFPVKGILCVYDAQTRTFRSLPGADDPNYVQSNPSWSPDGKHIVFARAKAYNLQDTLGKGKILLTREECKEFTEDGKPFLFDLYRVPFNDGQGGTPQPIEGASNNGMSNFFAKYSPDGKWIVFCKAKSYMLLQPDSELYIIPAEGGEAARLRCNTKLMNSWHTWSPNSRWLVFSSKANSAYTQLYIGHIDEKGQSTPAVLLANLTSPDRAANIPEFVNAKPTAIKKIHEQFLNDYSFVRAGNESFRHGEPDNAIQEYRNALQLNPNNFEAHLKLGFLFYNVKGMYKEGMAHLLKAAELNPDDPRVHHDLGMALLHQQKIEQAIKHLSEALRRMPQGFDEQYNPLNMRLSLGRAFLYAGNSKEAAVHLAEAVRLDPNNAEGHYSLAIALVDQGAVDQTVEHYSIAMKLKPQVDTSPTLHHLLGMRYAELGRFREAISSAEKALGLARAAKDEQLAQTILHWLEIYRQASKSSEKR